MIPRDLDAFRKLMERAVRQYEPSVGVTRTFAIPEETRQQRQEREHAMRRQLHADYDALRTLATATPEQLLWIVGECQHPHGDPVVIRPHSIIVTPRKA